MLIKVIFFNQEKLDQKVDSAKKDLPENPDNQEKKANKEILEHQEIEEQLVLVVSKDQQDSEETEVQSI